MMNEKCREVVRTAVLSERARPADIDRLEAYISESINEPLTTEELEVLIGRAITLDGVVLGCGGLMDQIYRAECLLDEYDEHVEGRCGCDEC